MGLCKSLLDTGHEQIFLLFQDCPNLEEYIKDLDRTEAFILSTVNMDGLDYHIIVVDGTYMFTSNDLSNSLMDLMCFYYVLNMQYPKPTALYLFLQHFIIGLKDSTKLPNSVLTMHSFLQ